MFVPLHDDTTLRMIRFQYVTGALIIVNVSVFLVMYYGNLGMDQLAIATSLGMVPAQMHDMSFSGGTLANIPEPLTLITYTFVHGGWLHLVANMAFLWVFADNVEDAFGHLGFLLLYLVCGIVAAAAHVLANPDSTAPLVGASGAVSGMLGAYLVLYPRARVWVLLFMKLPVRISATWALAGWIIFQVLSLYFYKSQDGVVVAWWAHIGGFAAGFMITAAFRPMLGSRVS
jgi:membrane associated rhomboid family serine protease